MEIPADAVELVAEATAEHAAGRRRFLARLRFAATTTTEWAATVEAIEAAGWVVEHFSVAAGHSSADYGYFLFKRR